MQKSKELFFFINGIVYSVIKEEQEQYGIREKIKPVTIDSQVNLAENDKGSFYIQKEWLEECAYGKGIFYSEYDDDKNYTSNEDNDSHWGESASGEDESSASNTGGGDYRIIFFLVFPPFSPIFYCFFQAMRKSFSRVSMLQNENNGKRSNQPEEI